MANFIWVFFFYQRLDSNNKDRSQLPRHTHVNSSPGLRREHESNATGGETRSWANVCHCRGVAAIEEILRVLRQQH